MKLAICDDDINSLRHLSTLCQEIFFITETYLFTDAKELLDSIRDALSLDVLLMDIDFGTLKSGIDYVEELFAINKRIKTIYVTGYTDRFIQQIFLQPSTLIGFLQKPVQFDLLFANLKKAKSLIDEERNLLIWQSGKDKVSSISCSSIFYLESSGHKLYIHTDSGCFTVYERLEVIATRLPSNFHQCHKSFLINMTQIGQIDKHQIHLKNGIVIPIAKSRYTDTKGRYFEYMRTLL